MPVAEIRKRQPDVALALVGSIVHYNQEWLFTAAFPGKGQKTIPSPVAIPRGSTFEQLPLAFAHGWRAQHSKQPVVELLKPLIDRFFRCSNQMGRDALLSPFELPLVKKAQPRRQERNDGCSLMDFWWKRRRRPRFVVVFQKARQLVLIIQSRVEMLAHGPGVTVTKAVVEPFVVSVIESLLLHGPFQIPVNFRHKTKVRRFLTNSLGCFGPEWLR